MNEEMKINCCVCGTEFIPPDDFVFICKECALVCSCGSDDVVMDWQIGDNDKPYFWLIECRECEKEMQSPDFGLSGFDEAAKAIFDKWMKG